MLPLGCWIYPSLGSTVYYMETGLNNAFYVATWMLELLFMLPLGCWIYPSLGSTVYYMETGLNNAFYVATWMLDLPELGKYSVLYGNRA